MKDVGSASERNGHGKDFSVVRHVVSLEISNPRIDKSDFVTCGHRAPPAMKRLPRERTGKCLDVMTARRRRQCQAWNFGDRLPGRQARLKDQKVDVLQYPGEEIPAGTICPARHSYQIQRDPPETPLTLLTQSRCDRIRRAIHERARLTSLSEHAASTCALPPKFSGLLREDSD